MFWNFPYSAVYCYASKGNSVFIDQVYVPMLVVATATAAATRRPPPIIIIIIIIIIMSKVAWRG